MGELLDCANLTKIYPTGAGIFGIDLSVAPGEVVGFVGPNGAGKTTTIRCLLGLLLPDRGRVSFASSRGRVEFEASKARYPDRFRVALLAETGYVPSELKIPSHIKLSDYLRLAAKAREVASKPPNRLSDDTTEQVSITLSRPQALTAPHFMKHTTEMAANLGLDLDRRFGELSRGTRQKFAVLLAWFFDPSLLLLDEATAGLDPLAQDQLHEMVRAAKQQGKAILYSSHNLHDIEELCDRVILIRDGRIAAKFEIGRLRIPLPWRFSVTVRDASDIARSLAALSGVGRLVEKGPLIRFDYTGRLADVLGVLAQHEIQDIEVTKAGLEEIVLDYYKDSSLVEQRAIEIASGEEEGRTRTESLDISLETRYKESDLPASDNESGLAAEFEGSAIAQLGSGVSSVSWHQVVVPVWISFWLLIRRRVILGWIAAIGGLAGLIVAFFPAIRGNEALFQYASSLPSEMKAFFGFQGDPRTYGGWLTMEMYSNYMPVILSFFAVFAGAGSLLGLIKRGEAEILMSLPVPRWFLFIGAGSEVLVGIAVLGATLFGITFFGNLLFDGVLGVAYLAGGVLNVAGSTLAFGSLALVSAALFQSYGSAVGTSAAAVVGLYVWNGIASLVDGLGDYGFISPFYHYSPGTVTGPRWLPILVESSLFLAGLAVAATAARRKEMC